jgi:hypothetical protein
MRFNRRLRGQWPAAISVVQPLADRGDPVATALTAWFMGQSGQAAQGVPYALKAIGQHVAPGPTAANYVSWTSNDPSLRSHTVDFFNAAVNAGWTVEPMSAAQQLFQQGDPESGFRLLTEVRYPTAPMARADWEALVEEVGANRSRMDEGVRQVQEAAALSKDAIDQQAAAITEERERVAALVGDTTLLVQNVAADNLAGEYAARAAAAATRASRWTFATLAVSVGAIALAATFVLVGLARNHDVSTIASKAAISLPLLALAAYLNRLGSEERRDARNWTHIELQIRTARPYLGNLPDALRQEVQAALALRFFPGQSQDPHGASVSMDPDEALKTIKEIQART